MSWPRGVLGSYASAADDCRTGPTLMSRFPTLPALLRPVTPTLLSDPALCNWQPRALNDHAELNEFRSRTINLLGKNNQIRLVIEIKTIVRKSLADLCS